MSFAAYLEKIRLQEVMRLLRETDKLIGTVGTLCRYQNRTTFYRAFHKRYGCNPGAVRGQAADS